MKRLKPDNFDEYNRQLRPCARCKSAAVEVIRNKNAVGAMCHDCGNSFSLDDPKTPLSEVVEWWNKNYGQS